MPTALFVASLNASPPPLSPRHQYAQVGTYNPNGEGLYRFTVDPQTGALNDKTLVKFRCHRRNAAQLTVSQDGKTAWPAKRKGRGAGAGASAITVS